MMGLVSQEAVIALLEQLAAEEKAILDQFDDEQAFGAYCALEGAVDKVKVLKSPKLAGAIKPRQHGRWIHQDNIDWVDTWQCSECGEQTTVTVMGKPRFKYCPMCGAEMEEN